MPNRIEYTKGNFFKNNHLVVPPTRKDAIACGSHVFFNGKPCPHGHISLRYKDSYCTTCAITRSNKERSNNNLKINEQRKIKYANATKDEVAKRRENRKKLYKPNIARNRYLKWAYGITHEEYMVLWHKQNGVCKLCKKPEIEKDVKGKVRKWLCVDHDHKTDQIRGLLCNSCNKGFSEKIEQVYKYFDDYLKENRV